MARTNIHADQSKRTMPTFTVVYMMPLDGCTQNYNEENSEHRRPELGC